MNGEIVMKKLLVVPAMIGVLGASAIFGASASNAAETYTFEQIKAKALAEVNGTILDFDYEVKGTKSYYEFDILASNQKYELKYDAVTGDLIEKDVERVKSKDLTKYQSAASNPTFSVDQIKEKALNVVQGTITEVDLERKGTQSYYEVEVVTADYEYELKFNAVTGELLKKEQDFRD